MRTKIIESHLDGLWLKVIVGVLDQDDVTRPSALPHNIENLPGVPLLQLERKTTPGHIWILDLSTGEGAAFPPNQDPQFHLNKIKANL